MKIDRKKLLSALKLAKIFSSGGGSLMPVLACAVIGGGKIRATDLELYAEIPVEIEGDGLLAINCAKLHDIVQTLESDTVEILAVEGENQTGSRVKIGDSFTDLLSFSPDEFPVSPEGEYGKSETVVTKPGLSAAVMASGKDDLYHLNAIRFDGKRVMGTDGHRLHVFTDAKGDTAWTIPAAAAEKILRAGKDAEDFVFELDTEGQAKLPTGVSKMKKDALLKLAADMKVEVKADAEKAEILETIKAATADKNVPPSGFRLKLENVTLYGRLNDNSFPDVNAVIPADMKAHAHVQVEKSVLEKVLAQAKTLTTASCHGATFEWDGGLTVSVRNPDIGAFSKQNVPFAHGKVEPARKSIFNLAFISDLAKISGDTLDIYVPERDFQPLVMRNDGGRVFGLVMPMRG